SRQTFGTLEVPDRSSEVRSHDAIEVPVVVALVTQGLLDLTHLFARCPVLSVVLHVGDRVVGAWRPRLSRKLCERRGGHGRHRCEQECEGCHTFHNIFLLTHTTARDSTAVLGNLLADCSHLYEREPYS